MLGVRYCAESIQGLAIAELDLWPALRELGADQTFLPPRINLFPLRAARLLKAGE